MATPRAEYWAPIGGDGQPALPWRKATTEAPPAPPTEVFWLERRSGQSDAEYQRHVEMGALPSFKAAQLP